MLEAHSYCPPGRRWSKNGLALGRGDRPACDISALSRDTNVVRLTAAAPASVETPALKSHIETEQPVPFVTQLQI